MVEPADYALVGGGSGGHLTPLVSVAKALKDRQSTARLVHIGHKNDPLNTVTREAEEIHQVYEVSAGKLRRYHGHSSLQRMFDIKTNLLNIRDFFRFVKGIYQAWRLLGKLQPKAILMKGGYVCASVGIAARLRHIPYMTHDSDAMVSLAHKIIAKHATVHATAMPPEFYKGYSQEKTQQVGVPISPVFKPVSLEEQKSAREELGFPVDSKVVLVTGGGLGAQNINDAILSSLDELMKDNEVWLAHITGGKLFEDVQVAYEAKPASVTDRVILESFTSKMHVYSAAADVIVTRASATALTEFAAQSKACVIVPNPILSGGHQLKNAQALEASDSVVTVHEGDTLQEELVKAVQELLKDERRREKLGEALHGAALPGAADRIADMLTNIVRS